MAPAEACGPAPTGGFAHVISLKAAEYLHGPLKSIRLQGFFAMLAQRRRASLKQCLTPLQGSVMDLLLGWARQHLQSKRSHGVLGMTDMTNGNSGTRAQKAPWARLIFFIALVGAAVVGAVTLGDTFSFENLAANREVLIAFRDAHYGLTVAIFIALYVAIVAFSLPGATIATLTGGFLFATLPGALFNVTGATLGAILIFLAARWGLGEALARRMDTSDGLVGKIKQGIDENQWSMLFLIRLVPAVPFFVANLLPALVSVPLYRFAVSTFFGIMPAAVVFTSVGAGLSDVFARGEAPDLGIIFEPQILLPILGLCALAALPVAVKAFRAKS